jgi:hypothetical protein
LKVVLCSRANRKMALFLLGTSLFLLAAGFAFFLNRSDVALGILWGAMLGELNLRLLQWRVARMRPGGRGSISVKLGVAFLFRYILIIFGIWFGFQVMDANVPAILAGLLLAFFFGATRVAFSSRRTGA